MKKLISLILFVTIGCTNPNNKPFDMNNIVLEQGAIVSTMAQQELGSNLMRVLNEEGPEEAVQFCHLHADSLLRDLDHEALMTIKRASLKARNELDLPTENEAAILRSYKRLQQEGKPLMPIVEQLNDEQVLYAAPILTKSSMCLNCHGIKGKDINLETQAKINLLYPNDRATGHVVGDLRGIWSIVFNKAKLTKAIGSDMKLTSLSLLKQNCYSCHNPAVTDHETMIAPPLEAIKRRYLTTYESKESFQNHMASFLREPTEEKAIMKGPVRRFGVMPKFQLSEETIQKISTYIYENEMERPDWFETHYKEMHPDN